MRSAVATGAKRRRRARARDGLGGLRGGSSLTPAPWQRRFFFSYYPLQFSPVVALRTQRTPAAAIAQGLTAAAHCATGAPLPSPFRWAPASTAARTTTRARASLQRGPPARARPARPLGPRGPPRQRGARPRARPPTRPLPRRRPRTRRPRRCARGRKRGWAIMAVIVATLARRACRTSAGFTTGGTIKLRWTARAAPRGSATTTSTALSTCP